MSYLTTQYKLMTENSKNEKIFDNAEGKGEIIENNKNQNVFYSSEGKGEIMEDVELGLKEAGLIPEMTAELIFVKALRENIQTTADQLNKSATRLNYIDWFLFTVSIICMGLTGLGINYDISKELTLVQLFGAIAITAKTMEKSLNLSKVAYIKQSASVNMRIQLRQIAVMEMKFYMSDEDSRKEKLNDVLQKAQEIWEKYDSLGMDSFIQPESNKGDKQLTRQIISATKEIPKSSSNNQSSNSNNQSSNSNNQSSNSNNQSSNSNNQSSNSINQSSNNTSSNSKENIISHHNDDLDITADE